MAGNVPVGVKIIAVLYYIAAVVLLLAGILAIVGSATFGAYFASLGSLMALFGGLMIVLGIIFIAFAVLCFFIGRGLWKAQKWARILVIIFAILGILSAILNIIKGQWGSIVGLIIDVIIGAYLLFGKSVKEAFA
jgi:hypothetical protein